MAGPFHEHHPEVRYADCLAYARVRTERIKAPAHIFWLLAKSTETTTSHVTATPRSTCWTPFKGLRGSVCLLRTARHERSHYPQRSRPVGCTSSSPAVPHPARSPIRRRTSPRHRPRRREDCRGEGRPPDGDAEASGERRGHRRRAIEVCGRVARTQANPSAAWRVMYPCAPVQTSQARLPRLSW
jgi:hypothetical protein